MRTQASTKEQFLASLASKPALIQRIEVRLNDQGRLGINVGQQEGELLRALCALPQVSRIVEIGTQFGCSTAWMALGCGRRGQIWTLEKDPLCIKDAKTTFGDPDFLATGCRVELLEGDARDSLKNISDEAPFDLIFIDANKTAYPDYLAWAKTHVREGGFVLMDNVYLFGSVFEEHCPADVPFKMWQKMKDALNDLFSDKNFSSTLIPTEEGLSLSVRIVSA